MKSFFDMAIETLIRARNSAGSTAKLAEMTGVNSVTLGRWISGERKPTLNELSKVFDLLGISLSQPAVDVTQYAMIPKVNAKAGAGSSLITTDAVLGFYAFSHAFLHSIGVQAKDALLMDVIGDSMEPLISDGDAILVDTSARKPQDGKIFLVGLGEELLVKRLQKSPRGWLLVSQNQHYAPMPIEGDDDLEAFRLYGRVRWFGKVV
ncbi:MAG: LexA family transcriptional regulator [Desulfovibrio sp.]|uniref:LexA family transcriptional regulator n=1 Tax=Desulfovibrio sp. TaxID=885 RepID=UPI0025C390B9|nr:LexA family transcriptional regulator [Desulfovibrio sp.]MCI7569955.1 LexA family transcriptional regulator [Desulfovibrio sp.]